MLIVCIRPILTSINRIIIIILTIQRILLLTRATATIAAASVERLRDVLSLFENIIGLFQLTTRRRLIFCETTRSSDRVILLIILTRCEG